MGYLEGPLSLNPSDRGPKTTIVTPVMLGTVLTTAAQRLGRLEVDDELEFDRTHHRPPFPRFRPLEVSRRRPRQWGNVCDGRRLETFTKPAIGVPRPLRLRAPTCGLARSAFMPADGMRRCHALSYGDLAASGPQLRSAARVSRALRLTMQVGAEASSDLRAGVSVKTGAAVAW
jgi:hypothetical protein